MSDSPLVQPAQNDTAHGLDTVFHGQWGTRANVGNDTPEAEWHLIRISEGGLKHQGVKRYDCCITRRRPVVRLVTIARAMMYAATTAIVPFLILVFTVWGALLLIVGGEGVETHGQLRELFRRSDASPRPFRHSGGSGRTLSSRRLIRFAGALAAPVTTVCVCVCACRVGVGVLGTGDAGTDAACEVRGDGGIAEPCDGGEVGPGHQVSGTRGEGTAVGTAARVAARGGLLLRVATTRFTAAGGGEWSTSVQ